MKWTECVFRPLLSTCRLNWTRRTSWGWWDEWDDAAIQTQDSIFEPWRSEAEHAASWSRRLSKLLNLYERTGFVSLKLEGQSGVRTCDHRLSKQVVLTTAPGPPPFLSSRQSAILHQTPYVLINCLQTPVMVVRRLPIALLQSVLGDPPSC